MCRRLHQWRGFDEEGCYLSVLASRFQRRADIVGKGFSGYNTRLCLPVLKVLFPNPESLLHTAAFFIFLGANDASFGSQKIEIPEYKQNLTLMVAHLSNMNLDREKIVLVTPPPVDETGQEARNEPFARTFENTKKYAAACAEVAKEQRVAYVDLFEAIAAQENWKSFFIDGLHFAKPGGLFCGKVLGDALEPLLPSSMPFFPDWREALKLDLSNPFPLH
ncbi:unnamed protein product [Mesocestoides corti]|uniref:SGNH hydrolase-type esterase domain-containing protein n=1 Tax=Mesocestoides corti TaxID=53468 RepID=A0A0R3U1W7_MESCO|nr:unnamed protein product [Mesocestoides corti]